jgi:hypothetical protein
MADLVVIVPSRGRPEAARDLNNAIRETRVADTYLLLALDASDPTLDQYPDIWKVVGSRTKNMVEALNLAADYILEGASVPGGSAPFAIGFMGDDHRPRTHGWDKAYLDALREMGTGIVYGNDLLQGENLPTQCAMTSDIIRALDWMSPPRLAHLFVDNSWKILGNGADCLRYLPEVIVEHMHPVAGKADWDEGHVRVNSTAMYERDNAAFLDWLRTSMVEDVAKVRALRGAAR